MTTHQVDHSVEPSYDCSLGRPATVESRMPLSGGDVAYSMAGTGPVVVLLHELNSTRQTWEHLIPALAHAHTVVAPDLPGHGESDPLAGNDSLAAHAHVIQDLLLALGHRHATIVGHGLGGGLALQTVYQYPERTDRLVLISAGGLGAEVAPVLPHAVADWRSQTVSANRHLGLLRDVPVLAVWGTRDTTIAPQHHRRFAERVPHAAVFEISGAGHYPHETSPWDVVDAVETFLAATPPFRYAESRWTDLLTTPPDISTAPPHRLPSDERSETTPTDVDALPSHPGRTGGSRQ